MVIADTILSQLGGNKFIVMTGSKNFLDLGNGISMRLARNSSSANYLKITLNSLDYYDMEFMRITEGKLNFNTGVWKDATRKTVARHENISCDMLQEIFTRQTGLYTHL